jgi:hypothetical protein
MYCGKNRDATIVLEAVASEDLWIWHAFFGLPGTLNDINVLQRSPLFARLISRDAPTCNYKVMDNEYTMGYYLTNGIYLEWETLVKSVKEKKGKPLSKKEANFTKAQEAARKDIERAFGVLQASCHCLGSSSFLGQENPCEHHEVLCHSTQHDTRG